MSYIYLLQSGDYVKVGKAIDPYKRVKSLQVGNPIRLKIIKLWSGGIKLEKIIHKKLAGYQSYGEWYKMTPCKAQEMIDSMMNGGSSTTNGYVISKKLREFEKDQRISKNSEDKRLINKLKSEIGYTDGIHMTLEQLNEGLTKGCGLPKRKAEILGLDWPVRRGWKSIVLSRKYPKSIIDEFLKQVPLLANRQGS